ncbi:hypothetical protein [Achromobacter sp. 2789STDY5608615]|uniref:hypothetical protein n=1 Tax=Achromobacter sp. 2789STDY5608615 TaxID=1806492 RepID=UPI0012E1B8D2|nr:hypothetical protein [Achromobacter sp. 2789STDY5608615]
MATKNHTVPYPGHLNTPEQCEAERARWDRKVSTAKEKGWACHGAWNDHLTQIDHRQLDLLTADIPVRPGYSRGKI